MPLEQDKNQGFKFSLGDVMNSGMYPEQFSHSVPMWTTGSNVIFTQTGVGKLEGWSQFATTGNGEPIRGFMQNVENGGADAILYAGDLTQLYRITDDGTVAVVGTGYGLSDESGSAIWDGGSTTWDANSSTWDFGLVQPSHWSMVPFGDWALATSGAVPQIRKGSGNFVDMYQAITGAFVSSPGINYAVDDVLTVTGGDGSGAMAIVTSIDGAGGVTGVGMTDGGSNYSIVATSFTGGSGTGLVLTFSLGGIDVSSVDIFKNSGPHILGFGTSTSDKEFIWCDADDPDTWVSASDNLAGQLEIRELLSPITCVVQLGQRLAVYGTDQMFLVNYLANDLVFGYQAALNGIGAVSKKAVVPVGRENYGLSAQGFFVTDGGSFKYIDEPAIRDWFKANVNNSQVGKAHAFHDKKNNLVRWLFPTGESTITGGVAFNYQSKTWSILDTTMSASDERRVQEAPFTGSEVGVIYKENTGDNADSVSMESWVRSKPMDLSNTDVVKELDSIRLGWTGNAITYRIGWSETDNGTITWNSYRTMELGFPFHSLRTAGRWMHVELYTNTLNTHWEVSDMEFIGRTEGTR